MSSDRPTLCDRCGAEFAKDLGLQLAAKEALHRNGPADAQELIDERMQEWHDSGHPQGRGAVDE